MLQWSVTVSVVLQWSVTVSVVLQWSVTVSVTVEHDSERYSERSITVRVALQ